MPEDKIQCRLVLDSCCDLPVEIINNAKVDLLEFPFNMNDGEHFDDMWKTMSSKEFYDRMAQGRGLGNGAGSRLRNHRAFRSLCQGWHADGVPGL